MGAIILPLLIQYGLPKAIELVTLWAKQEPENVQASEWLTLLKTLKPYDAYVPAK